MKNAEVKSIGLDKVKKMMSLIKFEDIEKEVEKQYWDFLEELQDDPECPFNDLDEEGFPEVEPPNWDVKMFDVLYEIYEKLEYKERLKFSEDKEYKTDYSDGVSKLIRIRCNELVYYVLMKQEGEWKDIWYPYPEVRN